MFYRRLHLVAVAATRVARDPSTEYEALSSPGMSSPGPSISERGGQNSPPHYINSVQLMAEVPQMIQHVQQLGTQSLLSSQSAAAAGQRTIQTVAPARAVEKMVPKTIVTSINAQPLMKTMTTSASNKISTATVYQQQAGGVKSLIAAGNGTKRIIATTNGGTTTTAAVPQQLVTNGKELKIIRMATMKNGQTVAVASGLTTTTNSSSTTTTNSNKKVTLQLKNSTTNVKSTVIPKNVVLTSSSSAATTTVAAGGTAPVRKIIRMQQQTQQNGRQILVPVTIQDLRSIKIVNSNNMKSKSANIKLAAANMLQQSKQGLIQKNVVLSKDQLLGRNQNGTYQKLMLTAEEKRLLAKEGISLPTSYPLTKHEERELKRIRRKIRNKISAQDSRKRKKEYVDGLEERVKQCTEENQNLVKRIKILQSQNHDLVSQMKRIQSLLTKGTSKTTQPATCLMVLLISMALVAVPNLKLGNTATQQNIQDSIEMSELMQEPANDKLQHVQQSRRALLFDTKDSTSAAAATSEEELNFDELMSSFNANALIANEHDYFSEADGRSGNEPPSAKRSKLMAPTTLIDYDVDDEVWNGGKIRIKQEAPGSMSPDSSSNNEQFEQKVREFQQQNVNGAAPQVIVDRELFELVGKQDTNGHGLYDMHLLDSFSSGVGGKGALDVNDGIDLLGVHGADHHHHRRPSVVSADSTADDANDARKLNASQQIQQQNNKRKLLL
uniref:BZIP domain-containing protein n=1 Tax=Anopheles maculatus TaxID=74869 RepID=A0A182SD48_9DIPT